MVVVSLALLCSSVEGVGIGRTGVVAQGYIDNVELLVDFSRFRA